MAKTKTTTTTEYPIEEFVQMIRSQCFGNKEIKVDFVIKEVGGDLFDRYPGTDTVVAVRITFDGNVI